MDPQHAESKNGQKRTNDLFETKITHKYISMNGTARCSEYFVFFFLLFLQVKVYTQMRMQSIVIYNLILNLIGFFHSPGFHWVVCKSPGLK